MNIPVQIKVDRNDFNFTQNHKLIIVDCEAALAELNSLRYELKSVIGLLKYKQVESHELGYILLIKFINRLILMEYGLAKLQITPTPDNLILKFGKLGGDAPL